MDDKFETAISLINDARGQVISPARYTDINWSRYQDELRIARSLILDLYVDRDRCIQCGLQKAIAAHYRHGVMGSDDE